MNRLLPLLLLALPSCLATRPPPHAGNRPAGWVEPVDRPARSLADIDGVARRMARASHRTLSGSVRESYNPIGPVASIRAIGGGDQITVNPRAAREIPLNAWAFIFGHEFAHQVYHFGYRGHTDPAQEQRADIIGATWAKQAGYELVPYLHWMLSRSPRTDQSHGDFHERAKALMRHFKVSTAIEASG